MKRSTFSILRGPLPVVAPAQPGGSEDRNPPPKGVLRPPCEVLSYAPSTPCAAEIPHTTAPKERRRLTICMAGNEPSDTANAVTINTESTQIDHIRKTIADAGLDRIENIHYLQAIKHVIGMCRKPLANETCPCPK